MRVSVVLMVTGLMLVVVGIAYAERSWGWTLALAAVGGVMVVVAVVRAIRGTKLVSPRPY